MISKKITSLILILVLVVSFASFAFAEGPNTISVNVLPSGYGQAVASAPSALAGTPVTLTATPVSEFVSFVGWTGNVAFVDATSPTTAFVMPDSPVVIAANFALTANTVNTFTDGGGYIYLEKQKYQIGEVVRAKAVANEGFIFYTWTSDDILIENTGNDMIEFVMPAKDVSIGAVFAIKRDEMIKTASVVFNTFGGTEFATEHVEYGSNLEMPSNIPTRDGYVFEGWYADALCTKYFDFEQPIYEDTFIYAKWSPVIEEGKVNNFIDVKSSDWFCDYVLSLAEKNIISGVGKAEGGLSYFAPQANITRAQFATMLANLAGANLESTENPFKDVKSDAWYAKAVTWAYNNEIVNGTGLDTFAPDANVTRQDMAVMLSRYVDKIAKISLPETADEIKFVDSASISTYASEAVRTMQLADVISGKPGNKFDPKGNATRAESAKMIYKIVEIEELN